MKQLKAKISENKKIAQGFYKMRIESPYLAKNSKPGQFVEVRCSEKTDPLLPRPLGCHRILEDGIELLYEVVGNGTAMLSEKKAGEALNLIGPLGNGFDITASTKAAILVAGGVGVAPLVALAEALVHSPRSIVHGKKRKIFILLGAKTKNQILCKNEFKKLGTEIIISTEDGSEGKCGLITDCLSLLLSTMDHRLSTIYACGPAGMLKEVTHIAKDKKMPCQVSLEEHMACGVGVCLGCPVKIKGGEYRMVCKDGPVFNAEDIAW